MKCKLAKDNRVKPKRSNEIREMNNELQQQRQRGFLTKMSDLNHTKARSRAAGFKNLGPVVYPSSLRNGQIVEIAVCHMLGVMQRYIDYRFSVYMNRELDMNGIDMKVVTTYGTKEVQMKHSSMLTGRDTKPGEYLVPVEAGGYRIMYKFFRYYKLPWPQLDACEHAVLIRELDYVFTAYTRGMYDYLFKKQS